MGEVPVKLNSRFIWQKLHLTRRGLFLQANELRIEEETTSNKMVQL
jgi:hypothetical protein